MLTLDLLESQEPRDTLYNVLLYTALSVMLTLIMVHL